MRRISYLSRVLCPVSKRPLHNKSFCSRLVIDFLKVPGLLYSPDSSSFDSDVFYPNLPSFVCPIYKTYCGTDRLDFWTRYLRKIYSFL